MLPVLLVLLLAGASAAQAGRLVGTVMDAAGEPVEGVYVQARAAVATNTGRPAEMSEVLAQAQSDGNGRYALDAPDGLFTLSVTARGYYVISAGGVDSDSITHSCPAQGECGAVDFKLGKPGVVEGWITDRFGDPVWQVLLTLRLAGVPAESPARFGRMGTYGTAASDDRGYFRIWNMRPGRYVLETDSRIFSNQALQIQPQEIELDEQGKTVELRLSVESKGASAHTISGIVEGFAAEKGVYAAVGVEPQGGERRDVTWYSILAAGQFTVDGLKTGDYVLRLVRVSEGRRRQEYSMLAELHVDRDLKDLRLTPQAGAAIRLAVKFKDMPKRNLDVGLRPTQGSGVVESLPLRAPDYEVKRAGLVAGEYEVRISDDDCYLAEPYHVTLGYGQTSELTIEVANAFAALHGRVRVAEEAQRTGASHFTVGVRGPQGSYKMQADDAGRFSFAKLPPGSYKIAAWPKPDSDLEDDAAWGDARGVANVELEPGFDVEIDVTASP